MENFIERLVGVPRGQDDGGLGGVRLVREQDVVYEVVGALTIGTPADEVARARTQELDGKA
jgi:hypothetical protein